MGIFSEWKTWFIVHVLMFYVFIMSGLIVSFVALLTWIFIWPWNKLLYRKLVVNLAYSVWSQFVFLTQWWSGSDCEIFLEHKEDLKYIGHEDSVVIMNHKYDIDWLMTWILADRLKILACTKVYAKAPLRFVPIIGWLWMFTESIFLKREWDRDRATIVHDLNNLTDYPKDYWVTLLIFCEGTRFTEAKHKASNEFAKKKGLTELKHHLLPRTKGFVLTMHGLKDKFPALLDMTVTFRNDGAEPTLMNILNGKKVKGQMFVRRIPMENIPLDTDKACEDWLYKTYEEKDKVFDNFVQNGTFTIGDKIVLPRLRTDLTIYICWAVGLIVPLLYYVARIFIVGSFTAQIITILVIALCSIGIRKMVGVSEQKQSGSTYGVQQAKQPVNSGDKKDE
jgi:lysophosphatidic acid acyltransferase/lysophosphatidylinositol acyltransferase